MDHAHEPPPHTPFDRVRPSNYRAWPIGKRPAPHHTAPHVEPGDAGEMAMIRACWRAAALWPLLACALLAACSKGPQPGEVLDEARLAGRDAASFPHAGEDYFHDMD